MYLSSLYLTVLMGPTIPIPLPANLTEVIHKVEVLQRDNGRSGFKIEFYAGREGLSGVKDYTLLDSPLLKVLNRVQIMVIINGLTQPLMDGIITEIQLQDADKPGSSKVIVLGQDISLMMDRNQEQTQYLLLSETEIVPLVIAKYAQYQLIPEVVPPPLVDMPDMNNIPFQSDTDYAYLKKLAQRFGYIFCVLPGSAPETNIAYWGPSKRVGVPQPPLTVNMGYGRNVNEIRFKQNALAAATVFGQVKDRTTGLVLPVETFVATQTPLSLQGPLTTPNNTQRLLLKDSAGLTASEAFARAQGATNRSRDRVVVAEGSLDTSKYGYALQACNLVSVQGAGLTNDGSYYVEQVMHSITLGRNYAYTQTFTLTRDGTGSTLPAVIP